MTDTLEQEPFHTGPMLAWDTETTGPDPHEARIVTASLVYDKDGKRAEFNYLLNPGIEIPEEATKVHGISTEQAREHGVEPIVALAQIRGRLVQAMRGGWSVVAFNAAYDFTVLEADLERNGLPSLTEDVAVCPVIDPHVIDKQVDMYRKGKRTLTATAEHYGVTLNDAHTASADAVAALHLARLLPTRYEALAVPAGTVHAWTIRWRREQALSLQTYFRKKDPAAVVCTEWPIQTRPES